MVATAPGSDPGADWGHPVKSGIRSGKLAGLSTFGAIRVVALPVLLQQFLQAMVGMVDKMLAGRLPEDQVLAALDAIGIGSFVGWFIGIAMAALGVGGSAIIARSMGAGRADEAGVALRRSMEFSLVWGAVVGSILWLGADPISRFMELSPSADSFYRQYIGIVALSMPAAGLFMVTSMSLQGAGETLRPAMAAIVLNIVNAVVSAGLAHPDWGALGVAGIAWGTAVAHYCGAILMVIIALRGTTDLHFPRRIGDEHQGMLRRFVKIGLPSFAEGISMWSVNIFILQFIATIGQRRGLEEGLQGVHIVAVQWEAFSFLPGFAIGTAAGTLAGQYLGANDPAQARRAVWLCVLITSAAMGAFGILFMTIGLPLTRLVSNNPLHLEEVPRLLFIAGVFQIPFAITMVLRQALRGVGDTRWCLFITTGSSYLVRLPLAWWLGVKLEWGIAGVWWALMGELTLRSVLFALRFRSRAWESTKV